MDYIEAPGAVAAFADARDLPTATQRTRAIGNLAMGQRLAALLGLPIGAFLAGATTSRATFGGVAVLAAINVGCCQLHRIDRVPLICRRERDLDPSGRSAG